MVKSRKMLPSLGDLELVSSKIKNIPNRKGEFLRKTHYGCYLLCSQAGLRVSEVVGFDLNSKTRKGLYRIEKPKGKKERLVYVNKKVVWELKKNNWQPNQTNRFNFYHFLRKIKQETNINPKTELTPHNLRRAFATYHAENGVPLPILQKLLGHSSIRTTALYWQNIHGDDEPNDILAGKKWLERSPLIFDKGKEKPKPPLPENSTLPTAEENSPEPLTKNPDSDIVKNKPAITTEKPSNPNNSLLNAETKKNLAFTNHQPQKLINGIPPRTSEKFFLNTSEQLPLITDREQTTSKEQILLIKIKQLEEQLTKIQTENTHLKLENKHLKALIRKEQETETKILQPLPLKIKN